MSFSEFIDRIKSRFSFGRKKIEPSKDEVYRIQCKQEGRPEDYAEYLDNKQSVLSDIERFEGYIKKGVDNPKRWKYAISRAQRSLEFIRPNTKEDIAEREYWRNNFYSEFKKVVPEGLDLRFHGTSIYNTKAILESGGIFSSVDINDGYMSSTDLSGEISVSNTETLNRTIQGWFADFGAYKFGLPCGCIFVLNPRTKKDMELKKQDAMESVSFRDHPEQLYGIFTSKENVESVKYWLENANLDPELCYDFEGFLKRLEKERGSSFRRTLISDKKQDFHYNNITRENPQEEPER